MGVSRSNEPVAELAGVEPKVIDYTEFRFVS